MSQRILVTAALPYANGSIHIGHLVEYTQADIYVRALKSLNKDALYICANDAHGTPIELNAKKQGITPEELVGRYHEEHQRDFARFNIHFDHFSLTHNDSNREITEGVYNTLHKNGMIVEREIEGNYCETDERFLPDRFIRGTCPKCGAEDQYGDVCESCGATYEATELKSPHCVLCKNPPVKRKSDHVFFNLSAPEHSEFLSEWVASGALQEDVTNFVKNWIEGGLRDWDISRDGPYFGFTIPGHPDKFFYVWMDAPLGYIASSLEWARENNVDIDELWKSDKTRIEHFIGKDIVYFHTLFWPAVLKSAGYSLPSKVHVHGMLTVNGKKMSKSRGTFINAADFAEHLEPEALRFYYASKFNSGTDDLDLSFDDFILRTNSELVNKHANLFSRVSNFIASRLDNRLGDLPFTAEEIQGEPDESGTPLDLARKVRAAAERIEENYQNREFGQVVRDLGVIADIGNEFMQSQKPWVQVKEDVETARETLTFAANICHAIAMYIAPITPAFSENGAKVFASSIPKMDSKALFLERNREMGEVSRLFERIDPKSVEALLAETQEQLKPTEEPETPAIELKPEITWDDFQTLDLRVGHIVSVEKVKKSKKLLRVMVNIGEAEPRQIVAGISPTYNEENLLPGHQVVVVANLAPAKLMGVESNGMILAAGEHPGLSLVSVGSSPDGSVLPPGTSVR